MVYKRVGVGPQGGASPYKTLLKYRQGLLYVQNGGSEKPLENSMSSVFKNFGELDCFKMAAGFVIG